MTLQYMIISSSTDVNQVDAVIFILTLFWQDTVTHPGGNEDVSPPSITSAIFFGHLSLIFHPPHLEQCINIVHSVLSSKNEETTIWAPCCESCFAGLEKRKHFKG